MRLCTTCWRIDAIYYWRASLAISRHVETYFMALLEGRLQPSQEARVRRHLASCDKCRDAYVGFEQVTTKLNLSLRFGISASNRKITQWWDNIEKNVNTAPRSWLPTALLPALLSAALLTAPLVMRLSSINQRSLAKIRGTTSSVPNVDGTNVPLSIVATEEPGQRHKVVPANLSTPPAVEESTLIPAMPAPLAPARP